MVDSTIFAYGQTGSGKTHSMYGPPISESSAHILAHKDLRSVQTRDVENVGLIPRAINEIFQTVSSPSADVIQVSVYCSFVQIYNENLFDMLRYYTVLYTYIATYDAHIHVYTGLYEGANPGAA